MQYKTLGFKWFVKLIARWQKFQSADRFIATQSQTLHTVKPLSAILRPAHLKMKSTINDEYQKTSK